MTDSILIRNLARLAELADELGYDYNWCGETLIVFPSVGPAQLITKKTRICDLHWLSPEHYDRQYRQSSQ